MFRKSVGGTVTSQPAWSRALNVSRGVQFNPLTKFSRGVPKKLFDDKTSTIFKFDVQAGMNRKRFGANFAAYARQMQIEHFHASNKPRAEPACLVALDNHPVKSNNPAGPLGLRGRQ